MAASKWQVYKTAKKYMISGDIDLDGGLVRMKICKATKAAAVSNYARSTFASLTHIASAGISQAIMTVSGYALTSLNAWQWKFDSTAVVFKATGSTLTSIRYAVIGISNGKAIGWCKLSATFFSLSDGNTLTITPNANGYFTLGGGVTA